jgi:hypothetical protein
MASKTTAVIGDRTSQRGASRQMDLFGHGLAHARAGAPAWLDLPKDTRGTVVGLIMQLILEHAQTSAEPSETVEAGHDR